MHSSANTAAAERRGPQRVIPDTGSVRRAASTQVRTHLMTGRSRECGDSWFGVAKDLKTLRHSAQSDAAPPPCRYATASIDRVPQRGQRPAGCPHPRSDVPQFDGRSVGTADDLVPRPSGKGIRSPGAEWVSLALYIDDCSTLGRQVEDHHLGQRWSRSLRHPLHVQGGVRRHLTREAPRPISTGLIGRVMTGGPGARSTPLPAPRAR
jgi:hypothetical protein